MKISFWFYYIIILIYPEVIVICEISWRLVLEVPDDTEERSTACVF